MKLTNPYIFSSVICIAVLILHSAFVQMVKNETEQITVARAPKQAPTVQNSGGKNVLEIVESVFNEDNDYKTKMSILIQQVVGLSSRLGQIENELKSSQQEISQLKNERKSCCHLAAAAFPPVGKANESHANEQVAHIDQYLNKNLSLLVKNILESDSVFFQLIKSVDDNKKKIPSQKRPPGTKSRIKNSANSKIQTKSVKYRSGRSFHDVVSEYLAKKSQTNKVE